LGIKGAPEGDYKEFLGFDTKGVDKRGGLFCKVERDVFFRGRTVLA